MILRSTILRVNLFFDRVRVRVRVRYKGLLTWLGLGLGVRG